MYARQAHDFDLWGTRPDCAGQERLCAGSLEVDTSRDLPCGMKVKCLEGVKSSAAHGCLDY